MKNKNQTQRKNNAFKVIGIAEEMREMTDKDETKNHENSLDLMNDLTLISLFSGRAHTNSQIRRYYCTIFCLARSTFGCAVLFGPFLYALANISADLMRNDCFACAPHPK